MIKNKNTSFVITENDLTEYVQPKYYSIGWRFLVYFLFISILPIFVVGYSMLRNSEFILKTEIKNKFQSIAASELSEIQNFLERSKHEFNETPFYESDLIEDFQLIINENNFSKKDSIAYELNRLLKHSDYFSDYFLVHPQTGRILVSTASQYEGQNIKKEAYFEKGRDRFFAGKFHYSELLGENIFAMAMPLQNAQEELIGVFAGQVNLDSLYALLSNASDNIILGKTGETYIVDTAKKILFGIGYNHYYQRLNPDERDSLIDRYTKESISTEGVNRGIRGEKGIAIYPNYAGEEVVGYFEFFPEFEFVFLVEQSEKEVFAPINKMKIILLSILLAITFLDILLAFVVARSFAIPLKQLTESAELIAKGDYQALMEVSDYDEFGLLAQAFNTMSETLILSLDETKNIIEVMPSALFVLDIDGYIKSANQSATELTEYNREDLIGMSFESLVCHFDHSGAGHDIIFDLEALRIKEKLLNLEISFFTKLHKCVPVGLSGAVIKNKQQKIIGFIAIIQDLTQIKASELALKASHEKLKESKVLAEEEKAKAESLLESIGEGLIALDLKGRVIMMNQKSEEIFKRNLEDVLGQHYTASFYFEDEKNRPINSNIFSVEGSVLTNQKIIWCHMTDQKKFPLSITVSPILFSGKSIGNIVTFRDITKEMEVDKAKSEFVSLASHQLRTPLTGIKWLLQEIKRKGGLGDLQNEYIEDACLSNDRMINLVNDLLNVSRLETGKIQAVSKEVDLFEFLNPIVREASIISKNQGRVLNFHIPSPGVRVVLDSQLIGQVITNLLSNAINYTDRGKSISISAEKKGKKIIITVQDEGIGISKEDQKKLFKKFFRSKEASRRSTTGSGLGLYIIGKILDVCSGTIECHSEEGKGTTFIVILPLTGPIHKTSEKTLILKKLFTPLKK